jgi:hypothetical protein
MNTADNNYVELPSVKVKELVSICIHNIMDNKRAQIKFNIDYAKRTLTKKLNAWYRLFWKRNPTNDEIGKYAKKLDQLEFGTGKVFIESLIDRKYESLEFLCCNLRNAANIADSVIININDLARIT